MRRSDQRWVAGALAGVRLGHRLELSLRWDGVINRSNVDYENDVKQAVSLELGLEW